MASMQQQAPRGRRTQPPWDDDLGALEDLAFDGDAAPDAELDLDNPTVQGFLALIDEFPELEDQQLAGQLATVASELAEDLDAPQLVQSPLFFKLVWLAAGSPATGGDGGERKRGPRPPARSAKTRRAEPRQPTADDIVNRRPGRRALPFTS